MIAAGFGVSETIIGLTIVAIGTSLPEVTTVVIAAYRGQAEVAIGNVLGSNIFNIFAVAGAASLTGPVLIEKQLLVFCLLYTSPSPRDRQKSRMPSSA